MGSVVKSRGSVRGSGGWWPVKDYKAANSDFVRGLYAENLFYQDPTGP